ncbi:MAG: response regulator, partial [Planctomycetes bacterium]|nr:response regulator [Planctomycetota bacterium]
SMVEDHPIGRLRIDVEDTGIGLDPAAVEKIFQPFSQADMTTTRRFGGTGLGLTISRQLAAMMEGTLDLHRAAPGEGAVFRVELPIHGPEGDFELLDADQSLAPVLPSTDVEPHFEGRVLLAEDNPVNRLLVTKILERLGLEVEAAVNGELAYHTAIDAKREGRPFDIILMDMQMPKMDGFEATRKLREAGYQGPIVALTAAAMSGDQTRCLEAGCDDYTTKPIDRRRLHGILTALIGTREGASPAPADRAPRFPCATA